MRHRKLRQFPSSRRNTLPDLCNNPNETGGILVARFLSFVAMWIILYGAVQGLTPRILPAAERSQPKIMMQARNRVLWLALKPASLSAMVWFADAPSPSLTAVTIGDLLIFGGILL